MQHVRKRSGFTLIEIMIVVVILGILASTVLPQFSKSQESAQESSMATSLNVLRTQVQLYALQHSGNLPTADIATELTSKSDASGTTTGSGSKPFGPYILGQIPVNPTNGLNTMKTDGAADGTTGWAYDPASGKVTPGNDPLEPAFSGKLYGEF